MFMRLCIEAYFSKVSKIMSNLTNQIFSVNLIIKHYLKKYLNVIYLYESTNG